MKSTNLTGKTAVPASSGLGLVSGAAAHAQNYEHGMVWSNYSWMHDMGHMAGYNMWGPGVLGLFFGLLIWTLAGIGVYHLYQNYVNRGEAEE
ncbi:MAG: hypothetical protein ABEJ36_05340 [Candidatus Nanosalina sp.]